MLKKIVIIGPESTGKSTLCKLLAEHYTTLWCHEFAREYLLVNGPAYDFDDLHTIAKGQIDLENQYELLATENNPNGLLFIDTDLYVMKVWSEYVFGKCHQFILDTIVERKYDLYLFCNTDLPWVKDELREYPQEEPRKELYQIYKDLLINQQTPWVDISGDYEDRFKKAIDGIQQFIL
jgi:NadR type nicotinamide-nucleotide adenylyltransferase